MKRYLVLIIVPLMLFGLERVNLIKNHSFEREDSSWKAYTGTSPYIENDSARAQTKDSTYSSDGKFSASANTGSIPGDPTPSPDMRDSAVIIQGFPVDKKLADIDSLCWLMKILPNAGGFSKECLVFAGFITDKTDPNWIWGVYSFYNPVFGPWADGTHRKVFNIELQDDTSWIVYRKSIYQDFVINRGLDPEFIVDSIAYVGYGLINGSWYGQEAYWDDIRLTGYADYDVGVKGILSGDSVWKNTGYTPTARIKNFGRKAADSFLVIATIEGGSGVVYADTLSWSLTADTEDTVSFKEFMPDSANYTLTISTVMMPDESDEDDAMSKPLYGSGITETPSPSSLQLEVVALSSIRYSLPQGERGVISFYDPTGRRIESLKVVGEGSVSLKSNLSSGVYFVKLETEHSTFTKKAVILH